MYNFTHWKWDKPLSIWRPKRFTPNISTSKSEPRISSFNVRGFMVWSRGNRCGGRIKWKFWISFCWFDFHGFPKFSGILVDSYAWMCFCWWYFYGLPWKNGIPEPRPGSKTKESHSNHPGCQGRAVDFKIFRAGYHLFFPTRRQYISGIFPASWGIMTATYLPPIPGEQSKQPPAQQLQNLRFGNNFASSDLGKNQLRGGVVV